MYICIYILTHSGYAISLFIIFPIQLPEGCANCVYFASHVALCHLDTCNIGIRYRLFGAGRKLLKVRFARVSRLREYIPVCVADDGDAASVAAVVSSMRDA